MMEMGGVMAVATQTIQAIPISPGIAIGRVQQMHTLGRRPEPRRISADGVNAELRRFDDARAKTRNQLAALEEKLRGRLGGEADIFGAQMLLVDDRMLLSGVEHNIHDEHYCAEYAVHAAADHFASVLGAVSDEYLRERAADLRDVANRLLENLSETERETPELDVRRIIAAPLLTPSETARLDRDKVLGFAVETGSATCHAAILARSMRIPAVAGVPGAVFEQLGGEDILIIDGFSGKVIVNPGEREIAAYRLKKQAAGKLVSELERDSRLLPETTDGFLVELAANIETAEAFADAKKAGARGVGLFRTEFLFMDPEHIPGEEEQFKIYKELLLAAGDEPVTIRTMDLGGDKFSTGIHHIPEANPFLGLRGIRLSLYERRDLFDTQLRALLRAGVYGNLRVMIPMVCSTLEIEETREIIARIKKEFSEAGIEHVAHLSLGAMIETPAAAMIADRLARMVDFFSIGTNDLIQYTMAVDRGNERVAYLYRPCHPAVLQMIRKCVEAAVANNIFVSVCGQMGGDPQLTPFLLGLGVHELSMSPESIPIVRRVIRSLSRHEAEEAAWRGLRCNNAAEAHAIAEALLKKCAPEIFNMQQ